MNTDALAEARKHNRNLPGKFEAESKATVYYWHCYLDGDGDLQGDYTVFNIEPDERAEFNIPEDRVAFVLYESDTGFAYGYATTAKNLAILNTETPEDY